MPDQAQVTALAGLVEAQPGAGARATALAGLVEAQPGAGARATALAGLVETQPGAGIRVTALMACLEVQIGREAEAVISAALPASVPLPELYDQEGRRLSFLSGFQAQRAYLLNDVGSGELVLARGQTGASLLTPDQLVLIRSRYGLSDWGGVIVEVERSFGLVTARLREGTVLLARWNGFGLPTGTYLSGVPEAQEETGTAAALIAGALQRINSRFQTRLRLGSLEVSGPPVTLTHTAEKSVLDEITELQGLFHFDFWTLPELDSSRRLAFSLQVRSQRSRDRRSQVVLWEGFSLGPESRRKWISSHYGASSQNLVEVQLTRVDLWGSLELGDQIGLRSWTLNLNDSGRILAMEPDETTGLLSLVVELE